MHDGRVQVLHRVRHVHADLQHLRWRALSFGLRACQKGSDLVLIITDTDSTFTRATILPRQLERRRCIQARSNSVAFGCRLCRVDLIDLLSLRHWRVFILTVVPAGGAEHART